MVQRDADEILVFNLVAFILLSYSALWFLFCVYIMIRVCHTAYRAVRYMIKKLVALRWCVRRTMSDEKYFDFWVPIFDTRKYLNTRLKIPLDVLGFNIDAQILKKMKLVDEMPASHKKLILSLSFLQDIQAKTRRPVKIWFSQVQTKHNRELLDVHNQVIIVDTRDQPTVLSSTDYVLIFCRDYLLKTTHPDLAYSFLKEKCCEMALHKEIWPEFAFQHFGQQVDLLEYVGSYYGAKFTTKCICMGEIPLEYLFCDVFHEDKRYLNSIIGRVISGKSNLCLSGPPGCGKTLIASRLEVLGFTRWLLEFPGGSAVWPVMRRSSGCPHYIDEFDKFCAAWLQALESLRLKFFNKKCSDLVEIFKLEEQRTSDAEYNWEGKKAVIVQLFNSMMVSTVPLVLIVNDISPVRLLMDHVGLGENFSQAFFRPGRFCPIDLGIKTITLDYLKKFCDLYMCTLNDAQIFELLHVVLNGKYKATTSLLFDIANTLGYQTTYYGIFPSVVNFDYRPTDELFQSVLNQFKKNDDLENDF